MPNWSSELRRKLLVDRYLQGRMMVRVALYWGLYHAALWHTLVFVRYLQQRLAGLSGEPVASFGEVYLGTFRDSQALLVAAMLLLPAVVWETLRQTHRVAGPMFRFQATLQALIDGEPLARVQLRKGDLLKPFEQTMNEFLAVYATRIGQAASDTTAVEAAPSQDRTVAKQTI